MTAFCFFIPHVTRQACEAKLFIKKPKLREMYILNIEVYCINTKKAQYLNCFQSISFNTARNIPSIQKLQLHGWKNAKIFGSIYESVCYNYQIIKRSSLNILSPLSKSVFKIMLNRQWYDVSKIFQEKSTLHIYNKVLEQDQKSTKEDQRFPYLILLR